MATGLALQLSVRVAPGAAARGWSDDLDLILGRLNLKVEGYTYLRRDMKKIYNPFSRGPWGNVCEFIGRREAVLDDPYVHSELYKVLRLKDDIERCGRCR